MADPRIVQVVAGEAVTLDLLLTDLGTLDTAQELATAAIVALGTDRRALPDDELPGMDDDRRGWWGDLDAELIWGGWPIGTRLWLLERAKITGAAAREGALTARVDAYAREALRPFVDIGVASKIAVDVSRVGLETVNCVATLYRGPSEAIQLRYSDLWTGVIA